MDYLVFFANDVEKISIPGKKKAQVLTIYNTNGKKARFVFYEFRRGKHIRKSSK